jgi:molybdopterin converting factor small subunit
MKVTVEYRAHARQASGTAAETVELAEPCSIQELLMRLAERHGEPMRRMVLGSDGMPHPAMLLFLGDQQVRADSRQPLEDGDVLVMLPPIAGG